MQELLIDWFGENGAVAARYIIAFAVVLFLLLLLRWILRSLSVPFGGMARGRQPRLAVIDMAVVDARRRLVLVRRDTVEHLLLIGGPSDLVVEPTIVRGMPLGTLGRLPQKLAGQAGEQAPAPMAEAEPPPLAASAPLPLRGTSAVKAGVGAANDADRPGREAPLSPVRADPTLAARPARPFFRASPQKKQEPSPETTPVPPIAAPPAAASPPEPAGKAPPPPSPTPIPEVPQADGDFASRLDEALRLDLEEEAPARLTAPIAPAPSAPPNEAVSPAKPEKPSPPLSYMRPSRGPAARTETPPPPQAAPSPPGADQDTAGAGNAWFRPRRPQEAGAGENRPTQEIPSASAAIPPMTAPESPPSFAAGAPPLRSPTDEAVHHSASPTEPTPPLDALQRIVEEEPLEVAPPLAPAADTVPVVMPSPLPPQAGPPREEAPRLSSIEDEMARLLDELAGEAKGKNR